MGVSWQLAAEGNRFRHSETLKQLVVGVVSVQDCHHTEVVHRIDTARQGRHQGQIVYHMQKNSLNWVCSMEVRTSGVVYHRTVEEEGQSVTEMAAGGRWQGNSEEDKVVPQHGAPVEVVFEVDSWMDVMMAAAVEVDEVLAEGIGDVEFADIADVELLQAENVAAGIRAVGIAD